MRIHPSVFPLFDEHLLVRCFYYLLRQEFGQIDPRISEEFGDFHVDRTKTGNSAIFHIEIQKERWGSA